MFHQQFGDHIVLRLEIGEEVMGTLLKFFEAEGIRAAYFVAFGAFEKARLAYFNVQTSQYEERDCDTQVEVVSLLGNVAMEDNKPIIHMHAALGDSQERTYSGHLNWAIVRSTLEVFVTRLPGELRRAKDAQTGLSVLDLQQPVTQPLQQTVHNLQL
jgi:uncharacterized protein